MTTNRLNPDWKPYYQRKTNRKMPEVDGKKRHILQVMYNAERQAKKRGLEWTIVYEDLLIPENCPYLDWAITYRRGEGRLDTNFSINRIDNSKGYIKGNIEICSDLANRMLQNAQPETLLTFAKNIQAKIKL